MAALRKLVGGLDPVIKRKYMENTEAAIKPRVVMTANDLNFFSSGEFLSKASLLATADRFLAVRVMPHEELLPASREERETWWRSTIPNHILWLQANRTLGGLPSARFPGLAKGFDITASIAVQSDHSSVLCEIARKYLTRRVSKEITGNDRAFVRDRILHVTFGFVTDQWRIVMDKRPRHKELTSALHSMALDEESVMRHWGGSKRRYWRLDPQKLAHFIASTGDMSETEALDALRIDDSQPVASIQKTAA